MLFLYNLGHVRMGDKNRVHAHTHTHTHTHTHDGHSFMIMLVLISNVMGVMLREWMQCRRVTHRTIALALLVLVGAVLALTYGNNLGDQPVT